MNLPRITQPPTATGLRDRVLAQMNGESRELSTKNSHASAAQREPGLAVNPGERT